MKAIQARHYHRGRTGKIRVVVVHDMEWSETTTTAEDCARMFATMARPASAHVCVDSNSAVRCVADSDTAWAAPGCNHDGLQLEMAGFARQTREQWLDTYSRAMLKQAARVVAAWCKQYDIPIKHLTVAELKAGKKGLVGHVDVSKAYRRTDHHDPGPSFPWDHFLDLVREYAKGEPSKPADKPIKVVIRDGVALWPGRVLQLKDPMMQGADVRAWQERLVRRGWKIDADGWYGEQSRSVCRSWQRAVGLPDTGRVDEATWESTWSWKSPKKAT
ncbi:peptidoglycan-binding domain-containing protein [Streptosporangium longisporum]|uniref:N-acetylmuramoyl-L-alanine amidase n=1 Tax=Streptosporangium longisporum TaxID=46187 RepID=A0ABP6KYN5_9ACTN